MIQVTIMLQERREPNGVCRVDMDFSEASNEPSARERNLSSVLAEAVKGALIAEGKKALGLTMVEREEA